LQCLALIKHKGDNYESNQQVATKQVNLLFLVSSTRFGQCFRPSSGECKADYKITYIVASCWLLSKLHHDTRIREGQVHTSDITFALRPTIFCL